MRAVFDSAARAAERLHVYITFTSALLAQAKERLDEAALPIERLRTVYRALGRRCRQPANFASLQEMAEALAPESGAVGPAGLAYALALFEEAELITLQRSLDGQFRVQLRPLPPGRKVDLTQTIRYNEVNRGLREWPGFATLLGSMPASDLLEALLKEPRPTQDRMAAI